MKTGRKYFTAIIFTTILCPFFSCKFNVMILKGSPEIANEWAKAKSVKSIVRNFRGDSMAIRRHDKTKEIIACDSIWGIKYRNGEVYRNYNDQYYLLRESSPIPIYSQSHSGYRSSYTSYYFSKNLDGAIYSLKWKYIKQEFKNDTCLLRKLQSELKWYQDYSTYNRKQHSYVINYFFKSCKQEEKK